MDTKKVAYLAWLGVNYGSTLQAYALNKSIEKLGYLCEVIGGDGFINGQKPDPSLKDADPKKCMVVFFLSGKEDLYTATENLLLANLGCA